MKVQIVSSFIARKGGTNRQIDLQNPDNLGGQPTDNGNVPNMKYSFSNSRARLLKGGWVREQVIQDLPQSHDIAAAQMHLKKGAIREMHWHRVVSYLYLSSYSVESMTMRWPETTASRRPLGTIASKWRFECTASRQALLEITVSRDTPPRPVEKC